MSNEEVKLIKDKIFQYFYRKSFNNSTDYNSYSNLSIEAKNSFLTKLFLFISSKSFHDSTFISFDESIPKYSKNKFSLQIIKKLNSHLQEIFDKYKSPYQKKKSRQKSISKVSEVKSEFQKTQSDQKEEEDLENTALKQRNLFTSNEEDFEIKNNITFTNNNAVSNSYFKEQSVYNSIKFFRTMYVKIKYPNELTEKETFNEDVNNNYQTFPELNCELFDNNTLKLKSLQNGIDLKNSDLFFNITSQKVQSRVINHPEGENFYVKNYKILSNPLRKSNISKSYNNLLISNKSVSLSNFNSNLSNTIRKRFKMTKNNVLLSDMILVNQSLSEEMKLSIQSFNKEDLVERLFNCPSDKYITLNSDEASKIGQVIIELIRSETELKSEVENERTKIDKLNSLLHDQKNKTYDTEIQISNLKKDYENKKNIVDSYIKNLNKKIEKTQEEFGDLNEMNENEIIIDEATHQNILNEINKSLQMLS